MDYQCRRVAGDRKSMVSNGYGWMGYTGIRYRETWLRTLGLYSSRLTVTKG
jgi:hypothetical protein